MKSRIQRWLHKGLPGDFNAIGDEPTESRSVATVKDANLALAGEDASLKRYLSFACLFGALACYLSRSCLSFQKQHPRERGFTDPPLNQQQPEGRNNQPICARARKGWETNNCPKGSFIIGKSPDGATDYRRGQATRSPWAKVSPNKNPPPEGGGQGVGNSSLAQLLR